MLSAKRIDELIDNNKDLLEALEEFDRTGQLSKPSYKERATFTIEMGLLKKFRAYCEKHKIFSRYLPDEACFDSYLLCIPDPH